MQGAITDGLFVTQGIWENMNNSEFRRTGLSNDLECGKLLLGVNVLEVGGCSRQVGVGREVCCVDCAAALPRS